ncbi:FAD dependent oxidoreductase superfamily [Paracoccidioides lutzii Pb01]|uniref:FAD dependent oxidoreductase superfamily n=1 Tax=Paracoccidioides lutzii (strain ATCC MYA-826 / Pb01) TaxID=502779 RepID=C1HC41_PARBA|nr:FAD dependent oxidoreductase superfamily [Paracoccidioides lutzii Pb01]EEH38605.2 FAD dependent oxidoreductase superfamily [Paracoccidioides lutzii Pb01]
MVPSTSKSFPQPNGMRSFWHTELDALENHRSTESLPSECDVLIIGAGYAGVSTAYHLLHDNPSPPIVVILEARGHLRPNRFLPIITHAKKHGLEAAIELSNFEADHIPAIGEVIRKEGIDCDFTLTRSFEVLLREDHCEEIARAYKELLKLGIPLRQDVQYTSKDAERISGVKLAKGCFHYTAAHIWPYKFVLHLLSTLTSRGSSSVNLQTNTAVTEISETPDPVTGAWTVVTESRGSINAKKVILATNAYTAAIAPQYAAASLPLKRSTLLTYPTRTPDGSIIVGGGRKDYVSDLETPLYWWEDSDAYTEQVWSGVMGFSTDLLPHVGPIPGKPNQYILAGFSGHGMPMAFLTAKGIAKMIRNDEGNGDLPFEKTGIPRLYKMTRERLECDRNDILAAKLGVDKVNVRGEVRV